MGRQGRRVWLFGVIALAVGWCGQRFVLAAVTPGGDTEVANKSSDDTYVGKALVGTLLIDGGSTVTNNTGYLGYYDPTSAGTVTVSGPGSKWINTANLYIGYHGTGVLRIEAGGAVSSVYTSYGAGDIYGSGTVTVTGAGSTWTNSGSLGVGYGGLTVADGGLVTTATLYAPPNTLKGNGTISVQGLVMDLDLVFDGTHGATQALPFGTGGTLNMTISASSILGIGYKTGGTLRIADGVTIASASGFVGNSYTHSASATISGMGSMWNIANDLKIGSTFSGNDSISWVRIEAGGQVSSRSGVIGDHARGTMTVTGAGSKWTSSYVSVGSGMGDGSLTIEAGGQVICQSGSVSSANRSTATVNGIGSIWSMTGDLGISGGAGSLRVESGGQVYSGSGKISSDGSSIGTVTVSGAGSLWTNSGIFHTGYSGSGVLRVEYGGQASNTAAYLGYNAGSNGSVTVTGNGSKWISSDSSYVAYSGSGGLRIENAGQVSSTAGYVGYNSGATGTVTVTDSGSKWICSGSLYIGYSGNGTLIIQGGSEASSLSGYVGNSSGSSGAVTVTGIGSKWTTSSELHVPAGRASLNVSDGALVTTRTLFGALSSLQGNGNVTAKGAVLDGAMVFDSTHGPAQTIAFAGGGTLNLTVSSAGLGAGYNSTGTLSIAEGVALTSSKGYLGYNSGSAGSATVTGAGSKWTNTSQFYVGNSGSGTLRIQSGGQVANTNGYQSYIGNNAGSIGAVTVTGAGSNWDAGTLYIGYSGSGTLVIDEGGEVSSTGGFLGYNAGSSGTVTVTGMGSTWTNAGALSIRYMGSTGTLAISNGGSVNVGGNLSNWGNIAVGAGSNLTVTGSFTQSAGQTTVEGTMTIIKAGGLVINGGTFQLGNGTNPGTLVADTVANKGTMKFSQSGATTITAAISGTGTVTQAGTGTTVLTGANTYTGPTTVIAGTLQVEGSITSSSGLTVSGPTSTFVAKATQRLKSLTVNTGSAEVGLADSSSGAKVLTTGALTLSGTGTVQVHYGGMMVDYTGTSVMDAVRTAVVAGYHGGDWLGSGITSSVATALPSDRAVGYAEASAVGSPATFMGAALPDATTILVRMTIKGDANLDGVVNFSDLVAVAQNYGATSNVVWSKGDFNYDGVVDFADLVAVAQHYNSALPASAPLANGSAGDFRADWMAAREAAVPEPGGTAVLVLSGLMMIGRRRCAQCATRNVQSE